MSREDRLKLIRQVHNSMHFEWGLIAPQEEDLEDEIRASQIKIPQRDNEEFESFFVDLAFEGGQ